MLYERWGEVNRRLFLQSTFGGVVGSQLLLNINPSEVKEAELVADAPLIIAPKMIQEVPYLGTIVFNYKGQPLGVITEIVSHQGRIDDSSWENNYSHFVPGPIEVSFKGVMTGFANVRVK